MPAQGISKQPTALLQSSGRQANIGKALGRRVQHDVLVRWIHERRPLDWVIDHLGEAAFDTEFVPPLVVPPAARRIREE